VRAMPGALSLVICALLCVSLLPDQAEAQSLTQKLEVIQRQTGVQTEVLTASADLENDTADVAIPYSSVYPGSDRFLVNVLLKNPQTSIAGFDFEIIISPEDLADFATVRVYVDSIDTCPEEADTCWDFFPIRECLIESRLAEDWAIFEAHGAVGDTTKPDCDTVWVLGIAIAGPPIPPNPNYHPLFKFGVNVSCVPDSLSQRTVILSMTGHLSDPYGVSVPVRMEPGEMLIWWSVPGDANNDSSVTGADIVFLLNYLFQNGTEPCVFEAADPNGDCVVAPADVVYLINYLFRGGSPPEPGCTR
jgi:hypothetical protein